MSRHVTSMVLRPFMVLVALFSLRCGGSSASADPTAETEVIHGIPAGSALASIVRLDLATSDGSISCSGTFLNRSVVLTAAHCVFRATGISVGGIEYTGAALATRDLPQLYAAGEAAGWQGAAMATFVKYDLALVSFPPNTATMLGVTPHFPLAVEADIVGARVFVTGFGENEPLTHTANIKRWGRNEIDDVLDGVIVVSGGTSPVDGDDSHSSHGDSGSALLLQGNEAPGDESIVGVVSIVPNTTQPANAYYASTQSSYARALFAYGITTLGMETFAF